MKRSYIMALTSLGIALAAGLLYVNSLKQADGERERASSLPKEVPLPRTRDANETENGVNVIEWPADDHGASAAAEKNKETCIERLAADWEDFVEPFTALQDNPRKPTIADQICAREKFMKLPEERREEELLHALNLLPDASIELLNGLLFGNEVDSGVRYLIFCDIMNRDEVIKMPILRLIVKEPTHSCYVEASHILEIVDD